MTSPGNRILGWMRMLLPKPFRRKATAFVKRFGRRPRIGTVHMGALRRLEPFSREWGFDRGRPVDRYFIEDFLDRNSADIAGRVLEVGTDMYTRRFGGERVSVSDVLHVSERKPGVTLIADLTQPHQVQADMFDCVILTNTLQFIYHPAAALGTVHRALKGGGILLVTVPALSAISRYDFDRWGDFWRFTTLSLGRMLEEAFPGGEVQVEAHGNVLSSAAFLYGLAAEELEAAELDFHDPDYPLVVCGRARKAPAPS
jgi:SAM-dependent methyltransferase